jgi:DNA end-binding protein Ku
VAARAIWKGVVRFAAVELPVKLYSAVEDRKVHFHLLEAESKRRVHQRMVDPERGRPVPKEEVRKGYEAEPGVFVVLDEEELEAAQPEPSRDIEITRFVDPAEINHQWYERPYWLGPDGDAAAPTYFAVARALAGEGREGVARWTMRNKGYLGALRPRGDHLMLVSLRKAGEVIAAADLPAPKGRPVDAREVAMAEQLVAALEDEFRPEDYRDEYRRRVRELVEAKAEGGGVKLRKLRPKKAAGEDLGGMLEASLERAKKERRRAS